MSETPNTPPTPAEGERETYLDLAALRRIAEAATPGPWAWEWIAEKSNEWAVGQAWDNNGQPLSGYITEPEELAETTIERRLVGTNESGHARAADAAHIAAFNPETAQQLITALRTERKARQTVEREFEQSIRDHATVARDTMQQLMDLKAKHRAERDALAQQVETLRQELATAIGQNEELRKRDSQWQLKWSRAVGTGTSNTARETDRANKAESALTTAQQDAARLREALEAPDWLPMATMPKAGYVNVLLGDYTVVAAHYADRVEDHPPIEATFYYWNGAMFTPVKLTDARGWLPLSQPLVRSEREELRRLRAERAALTAPADPTGGQ